MYFAAEMNKSIVRLYIIFPEYIFYMISDIVTYGIGALVCCKYGTRQTLRNYVFLFRYFVVLVVFFYEVMLRIDKIVDNFYKLWNLNNRKKSNKSAKCLSSNSPDLMQHGIFVKLKQQSSQGKIVFEHRVQKLHSMKYFLIKYKTIYDAKNINSVRQNKNRMFHITTLNNLELSSPTHNPVVGYIFNWQQHNINCKLGKYFNPSWHMYVRLCIIFFSCSLKICLVHFLIFHTLSVSRGLNHRKFFMVKLESFFLQLCELFKWKTNKSVCDVGNTFESDRIVFFLYRFIYLSVKIEPKKLVEC